MQVQIYTHLDPGILLTYMISLSDNRTYMHEYDPDNPNGYIYNVTGSVRFTVTADESNGYKFKRWVVRIGKTMANSTVSYVTTDPFEYSGTDNIWIRAESELDTSSSYILEATSLGAVTQGTYASFFVSEYTLYRIQLSFENDGTATFYSEGNCDTVGYLTTSNGWRDSDGIPTGVRYATDDDSGSNSNYYFTYNVAKNTTYYYWFKTYSPDETGYVNAYVIPPATPGGGKAYIYTNDEWKPVTIYKYNGSSWEEVTPYLYNAGWK